MLRPLENAPPTPTTRVLWVSHFPVYGGPHNVVARVAGPLADQGITSTMLLPTEPGTAADRLVADGVDVRTISLARLRASPDPRLQARLLLGFAPDVARIRRTIRETRADVVVLTGLTNPHAAFAASAEGAAVVWQILDSHTPGPLIAADMPLVRRLSDAVMFNGQALVDMHCGEQAMRGPIFLFTGPVDLNRFHPDAERGAHFRARHGVPPDAPFVGTVANWNPMKGIEWFIRAARHIHAARPDAYFLLSGASYATHAEYTQRLEEERRATGIPADRWVLTNEPPEDHYRALDVKVIASLPRSEGRTTTAPEAMATEVPVVATDVGAVSEVVLDGETGIVVPPLDDRAIATAVLELLDDPARARRLGLRGREVATEHHSVEPTARVHAAAIRAALYHRSLRSGRRGVFKLC